MGKFTILKTSWGIAIFYEIEEISNFNKNEVDEIFPQVFLKLNNVRIDDESFEYLKEGVESIIQNIKIFPVCFSIKKLDYNFCDYQSEGMYYMFRKWFFEIHNMEQSCINVYYNEEINRYIFPDLEKMKITSKKY